MTISADGYAAARHQPRAALRRRRGSTTNEGWNEQGESEHVDVA